MATSEMYGPKHGYKENIHPTIAEFAESLESQAARMDLAGFSNEANALRTWAVELRLKSTNMTILEKES